MTNWAAEPWHIAGTVGATTVDLDIDVLGGPVWSKAKLARDAINLGTGTTTTITRADTSARWRVTLAIVIVPEDVATVRPDLEALFDLLGPWTLTDVEGNEWDVVADVAGGSLSYENVGPYRVLNIPFRETELDTSVSAARITATATTIGPDPNTIPVSWFGWTDPAAGDFIGLYLATDPVTTDSGDAVAFVLTGALSTGSSSLDDVGSTPGVYQLRGVFGAALTVVLGPYVSLSAATATLTATQTSVAPGATINVQWANWASPTGADFIGITRPDEPPNPDPSYYWNTVLTGGGGSGSTTIVVPIFQDAGLYQLRGVYGAGLTVIIGPTYAVT